MEKFNTVYCEHDGRTYWHAIDGDYSVWFVYNADINSLSFSHGSYFNGVDFRTLKEHEAEKTVYDARKLFSVLRLQSRGV